MIQRPLADLAVGTPFATSPTQRPDRRLIAFDPPADAMPEGLPRTTQPGKVSVLVERLRDATVGVAVYDVDASVWVAD